MAMQDTCTRQLAQRIEHETERWIEMRRTAAAGDGEAERFYETVLFPLVRESFVQRFGKAFSGRYFAVVFSVGTSWQPQVLTWSATRPVRGLFLCTEETEECLTKAIQLLGLRPDQFDKELVDSADPTPIYEAVKRFYLRWHAPSRRIAVDITGGTKVMTSGMAMAGGVLGLDLLYVANDEYLKALRGPAPGSERLTLVPSPLSVFGDLEEQEAFRLAQRHDWVAARQAAEALERRVPSPRFHALTLLATAYEHWDSFDIPKANQAMASFVQWADGIGWTSLIPHWAVLARDRLVRQASLLKIVAESIAPADNTSTAGRKAAPRALEMREAAAGLVVTLLACAQRRAKRGMYDLAGLLVYRAVELMAQRRIHVHGGDPAALSVDRLPAPFNEPTRLLEAVNERRARIGQASIEQLPRQPGAVMLYVILDVLGDTMVRGVSLREVVGFTEARNYSFLAHGFAGTDPARWGKLRAFAEKVAEGFFEAEGLCYTDWMGTMEFVVPGG